MIGTQHKRYNPLIPLSLSVTCLFGSIQAHAGTLLFEDAFDGTTLNSAWIVSSSSNAANQPAANSLPSVANGILTLAQNSTDAGAVVRRNFTPTKKLRLELRHMQHAASDYYIPSISLGNAVDGITLQFQKSAWSGDNCGRSDWYNKVKIASGLIDGAVSCGAGDYLAVVTPLTTSNYLDRWLTTIIDYDADTGDFSMDIDGDGVVDYRATIKAASRGVAFNSLLLHAYGWYTGHWAKFDYVKLYDMGAAGVCPAPTTGTGTGSIQNETEDNGSIASANAIRADGSTVSASWSSASTDVDLYKFTTTQGDTFDLDLTANANASEVRLEVSTENASEGHRSLYTDAFSLTANTTKRISIPLGTAQTYYLNLRGWTVTANTRYEFKLTPRSTSGTASGGTTTGTSGTYDQGYSAGAAAAKAACLANPASCGITTTGTGTGTTSTGHASYDPLTGLVRIPYLDVPNVFGSPFVYSLDLNIVNASPLRFELKSARQVQ